MCVRACSSPVLFSFEETTGALFGWVLHSPKALQQHLQRPPERTGVLRQFHARLDGRYQLPHDLGDVRGNAGIPGIHGQGDLLQPLQFDAEFLGRLGPGHGGTQLLHQTNQDRLAQRQRRPAHDPLDVGPRAAVDGHLGGRGGHGLGKGLLEEFLGQELVDFVADLGEAIGLCVGMVVGVGVGVVVGIVVVVVVAPPGTGTPGSRGVLRPCRGRLLGHGLAQGPNLRGQGLRVRGHDHQLPGQLRQGFGVVRSRGRRWNRFGWFRRAVPDLLEHPPGDALEGRHQHGFQALGKGRPEGRFDVQHFRQGRSIDRDAPAGQRFHRIVQGLCRDGHRVPDHGADGRDHQIGHGLFYRLVDVLAQDLRVDGELRGGYRVCSGRHRYRGRWQCRRGVHRNGNSRHRGRIRRDRWIGRKRWRRNGR
mmetsp:Transcript_22814/g.49651  ORF Transcript_22814/g.49651 Transcript_22814/m.49651 type:complete len:420 (+) Transcript_22814:478-1737(+)